LWSRNRRTVSHVSRNFVRMKSPFVYLDTSSPRTGTRARGAAKGKILSG